MFIILILEILYDIQAIFLCHSVFIFVVIDIYFSSDKLLGLLRRRPSIRGKASEKLSLFLTPSSSTHEEAGQSQDGGSVSRPVGRTNNAKQGQSGETRDTSPAPKVTFRDNKSGEMRTVALHVSYCIKVFIFKYCISVKCIFCMKKMYLN